MVMPSILNCGAVVAVNGPRTPTFIIGNGGSRTNLVARTMPLPAGFS